MRIEVDTVMQENGGKFSMKALQSLSYLDRCLKESLRLYPSVYLLSRYAAEDVKLRELITAYIYLYTEYIIEHKM